ncbi:MAG: J domain-containing protein [Firmicutes bacterium]|jgi:hypothetical protein|uniref:J domain-containing protein n=1 Tax=Sulfobacillus benefaciens TaxID=453960 RepID=A0A2T2X9D2_9FIRM|nr:J domain-containing protein [Bacillota bacterium]MCL5013097.1 J domain-containing protein [Bacillota bacterium]PSR31100.1 MAG: hypothetical protein C7B43_03090 [Sulfobacillus benefaciens]
MTRQDAADLLGIPVNAPENVIRQAYRQQCWRLHPDGGGVASQFRLLTKARDILLADTLESETARHDRTAKTPGLFPLWSYPLRVSKAAVHNPALRLRAVRSWIVVVIGLPFVYIVAKELLMLSVIPLFVLFIALVIFRRLFS